MAAPSAKIRNVGPKSAAWLRQIGIRTEEDPVSYTHLTLPTNREV